MVAFRMLSRGIGIASTLILARLLNAADFGIVAIAFTISAALNSISNVGVTESLVRAKTIGRAEFDTGFSIQLVRGIVTGFLLVLAAPLISVWFSEPRLTNVVYAIAVAFVVAGFENIGVINFRRHMRFDLEFRLSAFERTFAFFSTITAAFLLRSYWALVIGMVVAKVVRVCASYIMEPYRPKLGFSAWSTMAGFSMWMWLSSLVYMVWIRADPLIVGSQISKPLLGLYVVALDIALLPTTEIMEPIGAVLFASFAAEYNAGRNPQSTAFILSITLVAIMVPIALLVSAASADIVGVLLGGLWSPAAPLVSILAISVVLSPFSNTAAQSLTASGRVRENLMLVLCASLFKVCVLFLAARTGSLLTIAVSAVTITSVEMALFIVALQRNGSKFMTILWPTFRIGCSCAVAILAVIATGFGWREPEALPLLQLLMRGLAIGIITFAAYFLSLFGIWHLADRPVGPERRILDVVLPFLHRDQNRINS